MARTESPDWVGRVGAGDGYWCLHNDFVILLGWGKPFILSAGLQGPWRLGCLWGLPQASQGTQHSLDTCRKPTASLLPSASRGGLCSLFQAKTLSWHQASQGPILPIPAPLLSEDPRIPSPESPPWYSVQAGRTPFSGTARKSCFSESTPVPGPGAPRQVWHTEGLRPVFLELSHAESESLPFPRFRFAHLPSRNRGERSRFWSLKTLLSLCTSLDWSGRRWLFPPCVFLGDTGLCECSPVTEYTCVKCSFLRAWCLNNLTLALWLPGVCASLGHRQMVVKWLRVPCFLTRPLLNSAGLWTWITRPESQSGWVLLGIVGQNFIPEFLQSPSRETAQDPYQARQGCGATPPSTHVPWRNAVPEPSQPHPLRRWPRAQGVRGPPQYCWVTPAMAQDSLWSPHRALPVPLQLGWAAGEHLPPCLQGPSFDSQPQANGVRTPGALAPPWWPLFPQDQSFYHCVFGKWGGGGGCRQETRRARTPWWGGSSGGHSQQTPVPSSRPLPCWPNQALSPGVI